MCEAGEIVELGGEEVKEMGVHRITSEAAKAYAARERVLGSGISILGYAAERVSELEKETLEKCGDAAGNLLPYAPGYAGKLMLITARLFWALAGVPEKEMKVVPLEELEKELEDLRKEVGAE
ncbi:MAG: hypothetical protein J7L30_03170 [Methanophagales archaeon]|nr:hypothetical protein [Methanophagales archaeon]